MATEPIITHSSWTVLGSADDVSTHLYLADPLRLPAYNSSIKRFDPKFWTIDYNALMVATILALDENSFLVPSQFRTNIDFMGIRWVSEDTFDHAYFKYKTEVDYSDLRLAFRHNVSQPDKFSVTIKTPNGAYTIRLAPYAINAASGLYECLDPRAANPYKYPASIIGPVVWPVDEDEIVKFLGRKDYIFILDFERLYTGFDFSSGRISPANITEISFDCTDTTVGFGARVSGSDIIRNTDGTATVNLRNVNPGTRLTVGDQFRVSYTLNAPTGGTYQSQVGLTVIDWTGFGTSNMQILCSTPDYFGDRQVISEVAAGNLLSATPIPPSDSNKYFTDMKMTGGIQTIPRRYYPQEPSNMGMTSGFDDGYNLTPDRAVEMTHALGYRDWWTCYIGMSHYFNARTAYQHKITGEKKTSSIIVNFTALYAGEANAAIGFTQGAFPERGIDTYRSKLIELFSHEYDVIEEIDGTTSNSAADRTSSPNPKSIIYDPRQTSLAGGLWWWDLEEDTPGPALTNCVASMKGRTPEVVIWCQGQQDSAAIAFPGIRTPVPTVARTKLATEKVFAYMRFIWGSQLPILVQELGQNWGMPIPEQPSVPIQLGQPTYLRAKRNSWGDVVFTWLSYGVSPAAYNYRVDIYHPILTTRVMRSITVSGSQLYDGLVTCDYPNELNVPDAIAALKDQFPWTYLKWSVTRTDNELICSPITEMLIPLDNTAFVKKLCLLGVNSLVGGYFTDLSDPSDHGGIGKVGRRDLVAASTFRTALANAAGLRPAQVMPVMCAIGSAPLNPMPYVPGFPADNYWWNPDTNQPGPNLLAINTIVQSLGRAPDYFIESGSEESTGLKNIPMTDWPPLVAAWKTSNTAMLAWMRANWNNAELEIWFQGATTSWFGASEPPTEISWASSNAIRQAQLDMSSTNSGFKFGSFVPNSGDYHTYYNESARNIGWVHYTVAGYHAAATDMGQAIGSNTNRALDPIPNWVLATPPTNLRVRRQASDSILITWEGRTGVPQFILKNYDVNTNHKLDELILNTPSWLFTAQEQIDTYGAIASYVVLTVGEYQNSPIYEGTKNYFTGFVELFDSSLPEVTTLTVAYVGPPESLPGGGIKPRDIQFNWTSPSDGLNYWIKNKRVDGGSIPLANAASSLNSFTFTVAEQTAAYGFPASNVSFEVAKYDPVNDVRGPIKALIGDVASLA